MSKTEYTEVDEVSALSYEMQQRVEALRAARRILEKRTSYPSGGIFSMPVTEPGSVTDLHALASWIITGKDPWAPAPVVNVEPTGNEFLARIREEQERAEKGLAECGAKRDEQMNRPLPPLPDPSVMSTPGWTACCNGTGLADYAAVPCPNPECTAFEGSKFWATGGYHGTEAYKRQRISPERQQLVNEYIQDVIERETSEQPPEPFENGSPDLEKDDVPIPFIQTDAGKAAVREAYDEAYREWALDAADAADYKRIRELTVEENQLSTDGRADW